MHEFTEVRVYSWHFVSFSLTIDIKKRHHQCFRGISSKVGMFLVQQLLFWSCNCTLENLNKATYITTPREQNLVTGQLRVNGNRHLRRCTFGLLVTCDIDYSLTNVFLGEALLDLVQLLPEDDRTLFWYLCLPALHAIWSRYHHVMVWFGELCLWERFLWECGRFQALKHATNMSACVFQTSTWRMFLWHNSSAISYSTRGRQQG